METMSNVIDRPWRAQVIWKTESGVSDGIDRRNHYATPEEAAAAAVVIKERASARGLTVIYAGACNLEVRRAVEEIRAILKGK